MQTPGRPSYDPEINTQEVADTGTQMDIISLATLQSMGSILNTRIKAITVVGKNFPMIDAATSSATISVIPITQTQEGRYQESRKGCRS